jgi:uncharacterized Rossmann fold enzyme
MNFARWEPVYETILADFGFDRVSDERARDILADICADVSGALDRLAVDGLTVAIAGGAPSLPDELDRVTGADAVFAAGAAAPTLADAGVAVDCIVTDLDTAPDRAVEAARRGTPVAAHAHGDNIPAVREYGPGLAEGAVIPTTQAAPVDPVHNFGGFTDGDRAAFLADALGAGELRFPGWAFEDPDVGRMKARKLVWAERLLCWLERRRGERFDVLEGRREAVDLGAIPDA